jgi:hypothetical protein
MEIEMESEHKYWMGEADYYYHERKIDDAFRCLWRAVEQLAKEVERKAEAKS